MAAQTVNKQILKGFTLKKLAKKRKIGKGDAGLLTDKTLIVKR